MNHNKVYMFLNDLQKSGIVNMFGANSYIESAFGVSKQEAHTLLTYWMEHYEELQNLEVDELQQLKDRVAFLEGLLKRIVDRPMKCSEINPPRDNWYIGYDQSTMIAQEIAMLAFEDKP